MFRKFKKLASLGLFVLIFSTGISTADAARFYFSPASQEFSTGCEVAVNIMLDTEGDSVSAADALIYFDSTEIEIVDQNTGASGIQIREGDVFNVYAGNIVNMGEEKIYLTAFNLLSTFNGSGNYGAIVLRGKPGVSSATLTFDYTLGNTVDSNVADVSSNDVLDSVGNGSYTFVDLGYCGTDSTPPNVTNEDPVNGSVGNGLDSNINFDISDASSGVDIDTVIVSIDGTDYQKTDLEFTYTGDSSSYSITIDPSSDFLDETPVMVEIDAEDFSNNVMSTFQYSFNQPVTDNVPPYVTGTDPAPNDQNVSLDSNIVLHVQDDISGVDIDTVEVDVDGTLYKKGDSNFNFSGDPSDYFIIVDPIDDFVADTPVNVSVDATDLRGNNMNTYSYSFNEPDVDNTPPYVTDPDPSAGASSVSVTTNIVFHLKDNLSGVNIDTVSVRVDGVTYNNGDFSFTGDSLDYTITINPSLDLSADSEIFAEIDAVDLRGNVMSTYRYSFNQQAVCGDGVVELNEQCEPPGTSACSDTCELLLCEEVVEGVAECGNYIVEEGEECDFPGIGVCTNDCRLVRETPDNTEISKFAGLLQLSDDEETALLQLAEDTDGDGLPDVIERKYGTGIGEEDSDGDGVSDLEEILDYGTDPNEATFDDLRTMIVNWDNGDVTGSNKLFVKGVSHIGKTVEVFASSDDGEKIFLGESEVDDGRKYALMSEVELLEGEYILIAESYDENGELFDISDPVRVLLDFAKIVPAPKIEAINDVPVVEDLRIVIVDNQPVVFGSTTMPGSQVFVVFESSISTSTIISDSVSGFFTVFAPNPLELGPHTVTVYAVSPEGVTSEFDTIEFEIIEEAPLLEKSLCWLWLSIILVVLSVVLLYLWYAYNKRKEEDAKDELLNESIINKELMKKKEEDDNEGEK